MTQLNSKGDLAIAELAFFAPAFCIALFVFLRHGLSKSLGWFYLVTLGLLRIIGNSCLLYSETKHDYSTSLLETYAITSSIGTAPLLLALLGILERVNAGLTTAGKGMPEPPFKVVHLVTIIALILAIVGGVKEPRTAAAYAQPNTGKDLVEGASILFLLSYLCLLGSTLLAFHRIKHIDRSERKLVYAGVAALPFLFVRVLYTVLKAFDVSKDFYYRNPNVYVEAFMQFAMEAIVVIMFITVGILTPRMVQQPRQQQSPAGQQQMEDVEGMGSMHSAPQQKPMYQEPRQQQQQQRNLGDYRPSRMIRNAIRGR